MEFLLLLFIAAATVFGLMTLGWLYQYRNQDAGIVDVFWTFSIGLLGILYAFVGDTIIWRKIILGIMAGSWSLRLGGYLLFDRVVGKKEDGRYQYLREYWGSSANFNFFWFFQGQGIASLYFSIPFYFISVKTNSEPNTWEVVGLSLWSVAFLGEWLADSQLRSFKNDRTNKGKTCRIGLWRFSRHPNYFFEWLHWCSYPMMLVGESGLLLSITCPLVMLYLLFKLTGIPHTEAQAVRTRGEDYKKYQSQTSVFIPWFPKKSQC